MNLFVFFYHHSNIPNHLLCDYVIITYQSFCVIRGFRHVFGDFYVKRINYSQLHYLEGSFLINEPKFYVCVCMYISDISRGITFLKRVSRKGYPIILFIGKIFYGNYTEE